MTAGTIVLVLVGYLGWILAALMLGLWWGEKGRRHAAERLITFGTPDEGALAKPVSRRPAREAEDRFAEEMAQVSPEVLEKAVTYLKTEAARQGIEGITEEQFQRDALQMLRGESVEQP